MMTTLTWSKGVPFIALHDFCQYEKSLQLEKYPLHMEAANIQTRRPNICNCYCKLALKLSCKMHSISRRQVWKTLQGKMSYTSKGKRVKANDSEMT